jgi:hypothetical protein
LKDADYQRLIRDSREDEIERLRPTQQAHAECAEKGIPQVLFPGLQAGATSPASFVGTIAQLSAE